MQAGGVYLAPTLQTLKSKGMLKKAGRARPHHHRLQRRHPAGVRRHPQGRDRRHRLPAGRPYAKYGMYYIKAAMAGEDLQARARPTTTPRSSSCPAASSRTSCPRRWSPRTTSTTPSSGATRSNESRSRSPLVEASGHRQALRPHHRPRRRPAHRPARRVPRPRRPQRRGQVHPRHHPHRPPGPRRGHGPLRRRARAPARRPRRLAPQGRLRLPEAHRRPRADGRREPLHQPAAAQARLHQLAQAADRGRRAPRHLGRARRPGGAHRRPQGRGPPNGGDRTGVELRRPLHRPRRADRAARQPGDRAPLHAACARCRSPGVTFLFISHHLQEVYEVCQTVTVLRDARWITTAPVADLPARRAGRGHGGGVHRDHRRTGRTGNGRSTTSAPVLLDVARPHLRGVREHRPHRPPRRGRRPRRIQRQRQDRARRVASPDCTRRPAGPPDSTDGRCRSATCRPR